VTASSGTETKVYAWDYLDHKSAAIPVTVAYDNIAPSAITATPAVTTTIYPTALTSLSTDSANKTTFWTTDATVGATRDFTMSATVAGSGIAKYDAVCSNTTYNATSVGSTLTLTVGYGYTITVSDYVTNTSGTYYLDLVVDSDEPGNLTLTASGGKTATGATQTSDTTSTKFFTKTSNGSITFSPSADATGSPVAGYNAAASTTGGSLTFTKILSVGETATLYAYDNLGHFTAGVPVEVVADTDAPTMTSITPPTGCSPTGAILASTTATILYTKDASIAFATISASDTGVSGIYGYSTNSTGSSPVPKGTDLTLAAGSSYKVYAVDNAGNPSTNYCYVTVTQDKTVPTFDTITATGTSPSIQVALPVADTGSGIQKVESSGGSGSWDSGTGKITITGLTSLIAYTVTATDNVGNQSYIKFMLKDETNPAVLLRVNGPTLWTSSGSAPVVYTKLGVIGDSMNGSFETTGITSFKIWSPSGSYSLNVQSSSPSKTIVINFKVTDGVLEAASLFGNPVIFDRLIDTDTVAEQDSLPVASALGNRDNALAGWRAVSPKVRATQLAERAAAKQAAEKTVGKERAEEAAKSAATMTPIEKLHALALVRAQTGLASSAVKADTASSVTKRATVDKPEVLENRSEAMKAVFLPLATKYLSAHGFIFDSAHNEDSSTNALPNRTGAEMGLLDSREPYCLQRRCKIVRVNG
jgi:hypothetical protein